jgi:thioredoxin type arsenate reductase
MDHTPKVLFLCTGNSTRSQMAEGFVRHFSHDHMIAVSSGIEPVPINPLAIKVMQEIGVDISQQQSKDVPTVLRDHFAYVIGVCDMAKERCPIFPFAFRHVKWSLEDPSAISGSVEVRLSAFRRVRDRIADNVRLFLVDASKELDLVLT